MKINKINKVRYLIKFKVKVKTKLKNLLLIKVINIVNFTIIN